MAHQYFMSAIEHLNFKDGALPDYNAFIDALVLSAKNLKRRDINFSALTELDFERVCLAFYAFKGIWKDCPNNDPEQAANFAMDHKVKLIIDDNLKILEERISDYQKNYKKKQDEFARFNFVTQALLEELDMNACQAIKNYQTLLQKRVKKIAKIENHVTAVSFGFAETMISVTLLLASITGVKLAWNIFSYCIGALCGLISWAASLNTGEPSMFSVFNKLFGEGSIRKYYCKETKSYKELTNTQLGQLGVFAFIAAIVGFGSGGVVAYTSFLGFAHLPFLVGIAAVSAACPPIGILFAAFVTVGTFCMLVNNFYHKILTKGTPEQSLCNKIYHFLKQPVDALHKVMDKWKCQGISRAIAKGFCYFFTFLFCAVGVVALSISCWNNISSFKKFNENIFLAGPKLAEALGVVIGGVINGIGRIGFVISSAIECFTTLLDRKGKKIRPSKFAISAFETINRFGFFTGTFETNDTQNQSTSFELASISACRTFLFNTAQIIEKITPEATVGSDIERIHKLKEITKNNETTKGSDEQYDDLSGVYAFKDAYLRENTDASFNKLVQGHKVITMNLFEELAKKDPKVQRTLSSRMGLSAGG